MIKLSNETKLIVVPENMTVEPRYDGDRLIGMALVPKADTRYNVPKEKPKASPSLIDETINETSIYKDVAERISELEYERAKKHIINMQRKQVGYGLDKYPEPLNADSWTAIETIDHIIEETIDKLHYLVMLQQKLKSQRN